MEKSHFDVQCDIANDCIKRARDGASKEAGADLSDYQRQQLTKGAQALLSALHKGGKKPAAQEAPALSTTPAAAPQKEGKKPNAHPAPESKRPDHFAP